MQSIGDYRSRTKTVRLHYWSENKPVTKYLQQNRPIIFIAHSLGGYICANGLLGPVTSEAQSVKKHTVGAIFLGTPFQESDGVSWEEMGRRFLNLYMLKRNEHVRGLREKSAKLQLICRNFVSFYNASADGQRRPLQVGCFSEGRQVEKSNEDFIVPKDSATFGDIEPIVINANHLNMCKYRNAQDQGFADVTSMIKSMIAKVNHSATDKEVS